MYLQENNKTKKQNTRTIKSHKLSAVKKSLSMLTCYDFQTAQMLNQTKLDLILVGDSLGNVVLGYDTTVSVTLEEMIIFGSAVKRGAKDKFVVLDMPFGTYADLENGLKNCITAIQKTNCEAIKIEGASSFKCDLIHRLTEVGIPVMGHIGLTPQSVHELGGYYTHGKNEESKKILLEEALNLQKAGCFSIVLECVQEDVATFITEKLSIPTIGIGAGKNTDGQVLVINDLLKMGPNTPPSFCKPIADFYTLKKDLIEKYLND